MEESLVDLQIEHASPTGRDFDDLLPQVEQREEEIRHERVQRALDREPHATDD